MSRHKEIVRSEPTTLGLPLCGVDSHAHLRLQDDDTDRTSSDLENVLLRAKASGVSAIGHVFLSPDEYVEGRKQFENAPVDVFFLLGIHPCDAQKCTSNVLESMRCAFKSDSRLRGVGEIGLDFYWQDCPHIIQEAALRVQIALASEVNRPIAIHSRDAASDTLRILEDEGWSGKPLLWHCFSGDAVEYLDRILAHGWHIAVGGVVTYPSNTALREALPKIPLDRLLLETDCPYLSPVPWRGKPNEPAFSAFTCEAVAHVLNMDSSELWRRCGDNARRFFGLS